MRSRAALILIFATFAGCDSPPPATSNITPPVAQITNGTDAPICSWPSSVALVNGGTPYCSGTLIHPQFVLTAAHCVESGAAQSIAFGENGWQPARSVPVTRCPIHPEWTTGGVDLALCELAEPVYDVPPVPIALGCEMDVLVPDALVSIVGFGNRQALYTPGSPEYEPDGLGIKRFTDQFVYNVRYGIDEFDLVGVMDGSSACTGDSGGGAFIQLSDGTWRVIGVAQSLFDPNDPNGPIPIPEDTSFIAPTTSGDPVPLCGSGSTYSMVATEMEWFEEAAGVDLTQCFSATGDWDPQPSCTPFPMDLDQPIGSWADGCGGRLGGEPQCGSLPIPPATTGTEPGSTSEDPTGDTSEGGTTAVDTDTDATSEDDALLPRGCVCRAQRGSSTPWLLPIMLLVLRRRKRAIA